MEVRSVLTAAVVLLTAWAGVAAASGDAHTGPKTMPPAVPGHYQFLWCRRDRGDFIDDWGWRDGTPPVGLLTRTPHPDFVLVQRDRLAFLTTDPVVCRAVSAIVTPVEDLEHRQATLGRQQAELGRQQSDLGARQVAATTPAEEVDLGREQGELGRRQAELGRRQAQLGRQQVDAMTQAEGRLTPVFDAAFAQGRMRPSTGGF